MYFFLIFVSLIFANFIEADELKSWKDRHAEGWAWYHDRKKEKLDPETKAKTKDPISLLSVHKKDLEAALAVAMLEPTKENVIAYMTLQKKWMDQSMIFSQNWQKIILEHPELAYHTPTTQYGVQVAKAAEYEAKSKLIKSLANKNTLLFFYEGGCVYSQAFSSVVKDFAAQHKWLVKAISLDGLILRDFPQSVADPTIAIEMGVNLCPSLFAVNTTTREAIPLAYGLVTISQIENNIMMVFGDSND